MYATATHPCPARYMSMSATASGSGSLVVNSKGDNALDRFGWDISSGDVNADGIRDIIVAAPYTFTDEAGYQSGAVYVYFGGSTLSATPDVKITGISLNSGIGLALEAGDINGDTVADLFASGGGKLGPRVMVFYGGTDFKTRVASATAADVAFTTGNSGFGDAMAYLGDVDGDGIGDIPIGSPKYSTYGSTALYDTNGAVDIFKGSATLPPFVTYADATFATYLLAHIRARTMETASAPRSPGGRGDQRYPDRSALEHGRNRHAAADRFGQRLSLFTDYALAILQRRTQQPLSPMPPRLIRRLWRAVTTGAIWISATAYFFTGAPAHTKRRVLLTANI